MEAEDAAKPNLSETPVSEAEPDRPPTHDVASEVGEEDENNKANDRIGDPRPPTFAQREILGALEVVERDSVAIAESFTSLFASLRSALLEVTGSSVDHMQCFNDATGRLQESALDAATKGNRYINSCLRLNEEMKGIDSLAAQIKAVRRNVDAMETAVNKLLRLP